MIPTVTRYSPMKPQLALTPTNNKRIANQSPHQRSGFSFGTLEDLTTIYNGVKDLEKTPAEKLEILKSIKDDIVFYLNQLRDPNFLIMTYEQQADIIRKAVSTSFPNNNPLEIARITGRRLAALGNFEDQKTNTRNFSEESLINQWETLLTRIESEILYRQPSPQNS